MARYGVVDLGSNTIRLVIYEVEGSHGKKRRPEDAFEARLDEKKVAGLSAYVEDGLFTVAGVERAVDVLDGHLATARKLDCDEVRIFATAVLRNCSNRKQAVAAIEEGIDAPIDVLSGAEEAHLGFVGASLGKPIDQGVLVDIGGGSTELTAVEEGRDTVNLSLPQGCVSSYAQFVTMILPEPGEMRAMAEAFEGHLRAAEGASALRSDVLYGIGGGARAAAKMRSVMEGSDKAPKTLGAVDVDAVLGLLEADRSAFAHLAVKAAPDRLHALVPGCVILRSLMRHLGAQELRFCKYGLREGYLVKKML